MPFADTWEEEAAKYSITSNDNTIIMPVLKDYTNDPGFLKFLSASDKKNLKSSKTPAKRYELALYQLKGRINYKAFHNDMMKVIKKKRKQDEAQRAVDNTVRAWLIQKMKDKNAALANALMKKTLRGTLGVKYKQNRINEYQQLYKLKTFVRKYDAMDKRKSEHIAKLFDTYKKQLKKIGMYANKHTQGFDKNMTTPQKRAALERLYTRYKSTIKKAGRLT